MRGAELSPAMLAAARPPRPRGVPAKRGWSHRSGRTDALPRPSPPPPHPAADGRDEGGSGVRRRGEAEVARGRREGGGDGAEREEAAVAVKAAGWNNAVAVAAGYVASGAEGFAGLVVAREERESGGGGGELERKRGLEPAARLPPKRRAVSAKRQFPPGCGRDAAALIAGGDGGEDGLRLGASPSHGGFGALEKAAAAAHARRGSSVEGGLLFEAAPANAGLGVFEKVAAAEGGSPMADGYHGPLAAVVKSSDALGRNAGAIADGFLENGAEGVAGLVVEERVRGAGSGELGRTEELVPTARLPPKWRMVSAKRRFPPGCGRDVVAPLAGEGGGKVGLQLEATPFGDGSGVWEEVVATDGGCSVVNQYAIDIVGALSKGFSDGPVEDQELEEGEVAPETTDGGGSVVDQCAMDIVGALSKDVWDGTVVGQELEEGEVAVEAHGEVKESPEIAGCVVMDDSARGIHEALVTYTSDEMKCMKGLQHEGKDAAQAARNDLLIGSKCRMSLLAAADKSSEGGPSNGIIQGKRVLGSNGMNEEPLGLAVGDSGSGTVKSKVRNMEKPSVLIQRNMVVNSSGSEADGCLGATSIAQVHGQGTSNGIADGQELEEGEVATEADHVVQESQVAVDVIPHESTAGRHEGAVPAIIAAEPSMGHFSDEKFCGNTLQRKGKSAAWAVDKDVKVMNKCKGSSPKVATEPLVEGPSKDHIWGKRMSEKCSMKRAPLDVPAGAFGNGIMRSKTVITPRKAVQSPAPLDTLHRSFSKGKEESSVATIRGSLELKVKVPIQSKHLPVSVASTSALVSNEKLKDKEASSLEDDDFLKALAVHEGKLELYLNVPSCVPSVWHHRQHGRQNSDARSEVRMMCRRFQFICRTLVQAVEQRSLKVQRVDLAADKVIRKLPGFTKHGPVVGKVPGVEVGDEFLYRVELAIVGLHRPYQGGIDTTKDNGVLIAISIVASGGYPDELSSSGELIYTGSGGKAAGKKVDEDQKLERGNLALKNCIKTKTPVRVIHGFKGQNREQNSHSRAKQIPTFTYDGLYLVLDFWKADLRGSRVFKYRLQRIPGQPQLPLHIAKGLRKSVVRPGLCIADISQGKERIPICVINNLHSVRPAPFKYITRIKYPSLLTKRHPQGCDCTNGCSDSASCACAVKNGGVIPFNFSGAVVHAKPLIFECGPSCRCRPSCHNRVSQQGIKIPLEVFRTTKTGWGVRSLRSISSGSFICEYVGELLHGKEADQRKNDEYLFDVGHNYDDEDLWKGLPSVIPGLNSSGPCSQTMEDVGFTIDAAEYGNIGRFINHSCSPNLYAQNVLWDHDDHRMPHIMFFAAENIPPLQELTYDYNYKIDRVHDVNGRVKVKYCHCGSPQCCGRLY